MKMNLERGDKCFVRLHTGEVTEATYGFRPAGSEIYHHWVELDGLAYLTCRHPRNKYQCRFQYPLAEMKKQMGLK